MATTEGRARCMCCGGDDEVVHLNLRDGRRVRSCDRCLSQCEFCREWLTQAVEAPE